MTKPDRQVRSGPKPPDDVPFDTSEMTPARPVKPVQAADLLGKVIHDLRSPLGTMKIWIHLLKTGSLSPEEQAHALQMIQGSASKLEEILDKVPTAPEPL